MIKIARLLKSFSYALKGLGRIFREEQNLRVQSIIAIISIVIGFILRISAVEWCLIIFAIVLVILMETMNSVVERIADILKPRIHEYVKEIKDITAGAVLLSSLLAVTIGLIIFLPYIFKIFF